MTEKTALGTTFMKVRSDLAAAVPVAVEGELCLAVVGELWVAVVGKLWVVVVDELWVGQMWVAPLSETMGRYRHNTDK